MGNKGVISIGLLVFGCALTLLVVTLNAWGQIRGGFNYVPTSEIVELIKWVLGIAAGAGTAGGLTAAIVAFRSGKAIEGDKDATE